MKLLHKVVKLLRGWADAEEDRDFDEDKECAEHQADSGEHNSPGEEVCYAECNAEDHCEDTRPISGELTTYTPYFTVSWHSHSGDRYKHLGKDGGC